MTDKEPIIIDGVDVSKCNHYKNGSCDIEVLTPCPYYNNCYYKQLIRKEQECEELKAQIETYSKMLETPEFKVALTDIRTGEREMWRNLGNKAQKYKQALDEIEKKCCAVLNGDEKILYAYQIKDIINKAKDNNNGI